jgi:hypothetical protein
MAKDGSYFILRSIISDEYRLFHWSGFSMMLLQKAGMKDRMDFPCSWEVKLVGSWRDDL